MMTIRQNLDLMIELCVEGLADLGAASAGTTLEILQGHHPDAGSNPTLAPDRRRAVTATALDKRRAGPWCNMAALATWRRRLPNVT